MHNTSWSFGKCRTLCVSWFLSWLFFFCCNDFPRPCSRQSDPFIQTRDQPFKVPDAKGGQPSLKPQELEWSPPRILRQLPDFTPRDWAFNTRRGGGLRGLCILLSRTQRPRGGERVASGSTAQSEMKLGLGSDPRLQPTLTALFRGAQQWDLRVPFLSLFPPGYSSPRYSKQKAEGRKDGKSFRWG